MAGDPIGSNPHTNAQHPQTCCRCCSPPQPAAEPRRRSPAAAATLTKARRRRAHTACRQRRRGHGQRTHGSPRPCWMPAPLPAQCPSMWCYRNMNGMVTYAGQHQASDGSSVSGSECKVSQHLHPNSTVNALGSSCKPAATRLRNCLRNGRTGTVSTTVVEGEALSPAWRRRGPP